MITNKQLAELLRKVAAVYEVTGVEFFRIRAYQNAASAIETLTIPVETLYDQKRLGDIPGIGPNLVSHIDELFQTGRVRHFDLEINKVPAGMFALMSVRGIGPKIAYRIAKQFDLNNPQTALADLKKLIKDDRLLELEGFGHQLQKKIQTSIDANYSNSSRRLLLSEALIVADEYISYLKQNPLIKDAAPLGSLRRRVETVGDIDIAFSTDSPKEAMDHALNYPLVSSVISSGPMVARVKLKSDYEVDIKLSPVSEWGSLLQHYTGSKLHNIALRSLALDQSKSLSEHGIKLENGQVLTFTNEEAFYRSLGLPFIPPEMREDDGELELAINKRLPRLIEAVDIKGDLHMHSNYEFATSHDIGASSVEQIMNQAIKFNYEYIGISDHNPKITGLSKADHKKILIDRKNNLCTQYEKFMKTHKDRVPKLLIGLEIDIRNDGSLALSPDLIDLLDYAIVSVHSGFDLDKQSNTKRILTALSAHPKIRILGHPTGRLLNNRDSIEADWPQIFEYAAKNDKFLEINASPRRLDLPDDLAREALRCGAKIVIDTDSHSAEQLTGMKYGLWVARRAWAQPYQVLNSFSYAQLSDMLHL